MDVPGSGSIENSIVASGVGAGGGVDVSPALLQAIITNVAKTKEMKPFFILRFLIISQM
jgi:hypothetical protein